MLLATRAPSIFMDTPDYPHDVPPWGSVCLVGAHASDVVLVALLGIVSRLVKVTRFSVFTTNNFIVRFK